jgi:O-antigen ligase
VVIAAIATVSWGVLAFGAVYPWAYWPLLWGAFVTGLLGLRTGPGPRPALRRPPAFAMLALACAVLLQLIPLPPAVLQTVSPSTSAFVRSYLQLPEAVSTVADRPAAAVSSDTWRPLSLDPRATLVALVIMLTLALMTVGGASALGVEGARRLMAALLLLGAFVAFVAIVQGPYPRGPIYGFWEARFGATARGFGPFVNRNHYAGWMVMAISAGLGYLMAISSHALHGRAGWRSRLLWVSSPEASVILLACLALMVMGLSLVYTASRSGMACLAVALLVVFVGVRRSRPGLEARRPPRVLMVAYLASLAFVTVIWTGLPTIADRFSYSSTASPLALAGRADLWRDALEVTRRFPLTGTGLNTYTVVTPFFQHGATPTADEAHSDYLQLAAEGGLLVGIPAIGLVIVFIREVRRRFRAAGRSLTSYWLRVGAVAGLAAIAVQESVEFSLQLPGNAVIFAALCAVALHESEAK